MRNSKIKDFKHWFMQYGNQLLNGYLRAKEDDNHETFKDWMLGEYGLYRDDPDKYEVPYHGLYDSPSRAEAVLTR